jgi:hypothetical protein
MAFCTWVENGMRFIWLYAEDEHRWKVSENKVLGRIVGYKRQEVTWNWRKQNCFTTPRVVRK